MDALIALGCTIRRVGSRVTCNPAPVGTDEDFLALVPFNVTDLMREDGFTQDGSPEFYTGNDNGGFRSFRKGDMNIITTESTEFFDRFMTATALAKRFNLLEKADRIALFQAVLYGVDADALEPLPMSWTPCREGGTMGERVTPEELHDWQRDCHGAVRKRRPLFRILMAVIVANAALWCGAQAYLTVDYVQQRTAAIEGGR